MIKLPVDSRCRAAYTQRRLEAEQQRAALPVYRYELAEEGREMDLEAYYCAIRDIRSSEGDQWTIIAFKHR